MSLLTDWCPVRIWNELIPRITSFSPHLTWSWFNNQRRNPDFFFIMAAPLIISFSSPFSMYKSSLLLSIFFSFSCSGSLTNPKNLSVLLTDSRLVILIISFLIVIPFDLLLLWIPMSAFSTDCNQKSRKKIKWGESTRTFRDFSSRTLLSAS